MKVIAKRTAVHAGDDPDILKFDMADDAAPEDVLRRAMDKRWLPSIQGDRATWSIVADEPLAIGALEWPELKFLPFFADRMAPTNGVLRLHFNYHAQIDPDVVYAIFWGTKWRA